MRSPRPLPEVPRVVPVAPYVAPIQTDILDFLPAPSTLPPAAVPVEAPAAMESVAEVPSDNADVVDDGLGYADHAVVAAPRDANGAFLPRPVPTITLPLIVRIATLGQALYGKTWMARVAADIGEYERKVRRWANWEGRPPADALSKLRAAAEGQIARIRDALNPVGGARPTEVEASKASDAPHVGNGDPVAQALARHVELRKAALIERTKTTSKRSRVDDA